MKREYIYIISLFLVILLLITLRKPIKKVTAKLTRGYKNNNPGNIRLTKSFWKGEIQGTDRDFKTFVNMEYGYRAIFALLRDYINKGYNTIDKIINRYAPPNENITSSYIKTIVKYTGVKPNLPINFSDTETIKNMVTGISFHENGVDPDISQIESGYKLLLTV